MLKLKTQLEKFVNSLAKMPQIEFAKPVQSPKIFTLALHERTIKKYANVFCYIVFALDFEGVTTYSIV